MKTPQQIVDHMKAIEADDWMGTKRGDLLNYLPFDLAQPHLKEGTTADQWADAVKDVKPPLQAAKEYLDFAWDKANNCRGLSAGRSLDHLMTWLWLAGFDDLVQNEFKDYERYGKRQLVIASVICGFDWRSHDDGQWVNDEDGPGLSDARLRAEIEDAEAVARKYMPAAVAG